MMGNESVPRMVFAGATDVGKLRDHNEDAYLIDAEHGLFIVSDGMGGAQAGELASQVVVSVLPRIIEERLQPDARPSAAVVRRILRDAIMELSRQLRAQSTGQAGLKGMGATVVLALIRKRWAYIAHMGDSRAYLFREGQPTQLTDDHSIVGILLRDGEITPEEAKTHPARGRLSRFVGMEGEVYPDVRTVAMKKGERLLLCTDGLTGMVSDKDIQTILESNLDPQQACDALITAANDAGGKDNITAVVVDRSSGPS